MGRSIRVQIMGREYGLLVAEDDEEITRDIAAYVNARMQAFKKAHPEQSELTTAIITALALAEELYTAWEEQDVLREQVAEALAGLDARLAEALEPASPAADAVDGGAVPPSDVQISALEGEDDEVLD